MAEKAPVGSRLRRGRRPVTGKWHSMPLRTQLAHGSRRSHLTLRRRQVTQLHILRPSWSREVAAGPC